MTDDLTARDDGVLERTPEGGVIRFERHLADDVRDVWDAITTPAGQPVTMTCTILRLEPPRLLEHTHPAPGSSMRWELEAAPTGCVLRLSHVVPDVQAAVDGGHLVGLQTSLDRLEPSLAGRPEPWDWHSFSDSRTHYARLGLAAPLEAS